MHAKEEPILFLLFGVNIILGILGKVIEPVQILGDAHVALGKSQKFLLFDLHDAIRDVSFTETFLEFRPSDVVVIYHNFLRLSHQMLAGPSR